MVEPSQHEPVDQTRNDPGESNDPRTSAGDFGAHLWTSINQIFERLGNLDQKINQISADQGKLKESVEKHDKLITRMVFTVGGAIVVVLILWFIYANFLKGRITINSVGM